MVKPKTDEQDDADRDDDDRDDADSSEEEVVDADLGSNDEGSDDDSSGDDDDPASPADDGADEPSGDEAEGEDEDDEEQAAAQLGIQRYVLAAFFATGILGAYIFGKLIHGVWAWAANKDWFISTVPALAAFTDEQKTNYGTVLGAIIAIILVVRTYRRAAVRAWADEVANELNKVKWPTRKEVYSSTVVVIAASAVATIYLALLDQLWSFVIDFVSRAGS